MHKYITFFNTDLGWINTMNKYFKRVLLISSCFFLLTNCAPDIRDDVTKNPDAKVPFDELQTWPKADSDGIFQFDNRRYVEVRLGETLEDIAKRTDEDPMVIAELNQIRLDGTLQPGKVLLLPHRDVRSGGQDATGIGTSETDTSDFEIDIRGRTENYYRHRVQKGETAYTIANLYDISVRTLADWNELDADFAVMEGEVLIIPATNQVIEENVQISTNPEPVSSPSQEPEKEEEPATVATEKPVEEVEVVTEIEEETEVKTETPEVRVAEPIIPDEIDCNNFEPAQFGFDTPLSGELIADYSNQPSGNKGIDISAPIGTPVVAVGSGKVALISDLAEGTKVLLVLHECNVFSIYQNLQDITLERGDLVARGQQLGTLDSTLGYLHFEIRVGPDSADPKRYLPSNSYNN